MPAVVSRLHDKVKHAPRILDPDKLRDRVKSRKPSGHPWIAGEQIARRSRSETQSASRRGFPRQLNIGNAVEVDRREIGGWSPAHYEDALVRDGVMYPPPQPCIEYKPAENEKEPDTDEHRPPGVEEQRRALFCRHIGPENREAAPKQAEWYQEDIAT